MRVKLTDRLLAGLKSGDEPHFDATVPGLSIDTGARTRTWFFHYTSPRSGKRARVLLGHYPSTSLAAARARGQEARGFLDEGRDPKDVLSAQPGAMSVADLIAAYLELHVRPKLRSAKAIERRFRKNTMPVIGSLRLVDLHRRDLSRVIDPILRRGRPVEASRSFEDVRAMLRWAVSRGDLDHNPAEGMRKPAEAKPRERVLSDSEIATLWNALPTVLAKSRQCQCILKLCLVTGARVGEISGMTRGEIDFAKSLWTLPAARSKNKHSHTVPLSDLAADLVNEFLADDKNLPAHAVSKTVGNAQERFGLPHWTPHDLRRTTVSKMAELGIAPIVLGACINHRSSTKAGVTLGVYVQYDYAREKREALNMWAERLSAIVFGSGAAKVLPMRGAR